MAAEIGAKGEIKNALHPFFPVWKWQMTAKQRGGRGRRKLLGKKELGKKAVHGLENLREEQVTAGYDAATKIFEGRHGATLGASIRPRFQASLSRENREAHKSINSPKGMADSPLEKW